MRGARTAQSTSAMIGRGQRPVDPKAEAAKLIYSMLSGLKDLTMVAIMIYLVCWELRASETGNFSGNRDVGLSSSESCLNAEAAYGCGAGLIELSSSDNALYNNIYALPVCYTSTLVASPTTQSQKDAQRYSLCFDDSKNVVKTEYSSLPGGGGSLKEYESVQKLPEGLQCLFGVTSSSSSKSNVNAHNISALLNQKTLSEMFPQVGLAHRNYFPFSSVLIGICCVSIIMKLTKNVVSKSTSGGSDINQSMHSQGRSNNNSGGHTRALSGRDVRGTSMTRGVDPSGRRSNISGTSAKQAEEDLVSRTSIALHLLVACLLLASASMMSQIAQESCPVDAGEAAFSVRGEVDYTTKSYTEDDLFTLCYSLRACDLSMRSVVDIDGTSALDKESSSGFGYRRVAIFFACLLFFYLLVHIFVSAGMLDFIFNNQGEAKCCISLRTRGRRRVDIMSNTSRQQQQQQRWVRLSSIRQIGSTAHSRQPLHHREREHVTTWSRVISMMRRLRVSRYTETETGPGSLSPSRRGGRGGVTGNGAIANSSHGFRNRVPRVELLSIEGGGGTGTGGPSFGGTSASYAREYGLHEDDDWFGDQHLTGGIEAIPGGGLLRNNTNTSTSSNINASANTSDRGANDRYFHFTITSFEQHVDRSQRRLRRRNLMLLGLYLGFNLSQLDGLLSGAEPDDKKTEKRKEKEKEKEQMSLASPLLPISSSSGTYFAPSQNQNKNQDKGEAGCDERKEEEEGRSYSQPETEAEIEDDEAISDSLLLLLFDEENMCPICLQSFRARSHTHQQRLLERIAMLKAASSMCVNKEEPEGTDGASRIAPISVSVPPPGDNINNNNSKDVVPGSEEHAQGLDLLDRRWGETKDDNYGGYDTGGLPVQAVDTVWAFSALQDVCSLIREKDEERDDGDRKTDADADADADDGDGDVEEAHVKAHTSQEDGPRDWQALLESSSGNEEVDLADTPMMLECGHVYHTKCIRDWSALSNSCPVCRCEIDEV